MTTTSAQEQTRTRIKEEIINRLSRGESAQQIVDRMDEVGSILDIGSRLIVTLWNDPVSISIYRETRGASDILM